MGKKEREEELKAKQIKTKRTNRKVDNNIFINFVNRVYIYIRILLELTRDNKLTIPKVYNALTIGKILIPKDIILYFIYDLKRQIVKYFSQETTINTLRKIILISGYIIRLVIYYAKGIKAYLARYLRDKDPI